MVGGRVSDHLPLLSERAGHCCQEMSSADCILSSVPANACTIKTKRLIVLRPVDPRLSMFRACDVHTSSLGTCYLGFGGGRSYSEQRRIDSVLICRACPISNLPSPLPPPVPGTAFRRRTFPPSFPQKREGHNHSWKVEKKKKNRDMPKTPSRKKKRSQPINHPITPPTLLSSRPSEHSIPSKNTPPSLLTTPNHLHPPPRHILPLLSISSLIHCSSRFSPPLSPFHIYYLNSYDLRRDSPCSSAYLLRFLACCC